MRNLNDAAWTLRQAARAEAAELATLADICAAIRREAGSADRPSAMSACYQRLKAEGHASCPAIRQAMLANDRQAAATLLLAEINL